MVLQYSNLRNKYASLKFSSLFFLLLFSLSLSLSTIAVAQITSNMDKRSITQEDRELIKFKKNKVKTRTAIISYHGNFAKAMPGSVYNEYIICDESGNKIEHTKFQGNETVDTKWIYEYDAKGNNTKMVGIDNYGRIVYTRTSLYDGNSNEVERDEVRSGANNSYKTKFHYNDAGLVTEVETFKANDVKILSEKFEYDGAKLVGQSSFNEKGEKVSVTKYKHNSAGLITEMIVSTPGKDDSSVETYAYDNNGNLTEHKAASFKQMFSYNSNSDVVVDILYNILGKRQHKYELTYNENGLLKERIRFNSKDEPVYTIKFEYEYF